MSHDLYHVFLSGPRYVLGEHRAGHTTIEGLAARAAEFGMPLDAGLWGWGDVHRTGRDLEDLAVDSGSATLRAAGVDPASVDALLLCSTRIPGPAEGHGAFVERVLTGIGLPDIPFYGQTLNRCVNLLAALDVASAFVTAGRHRRVLVITTDRVAGEALRVTNYALFSDGAASCLVSADAEAAGRADGYRLVSCATAQEAASLEWSNELSSDLARQVNDRLLTPLGMKLGDVSGLMGANLLKPLVVMKERQAGFTMDQIYVDNIPRVGHCFAADPLINLVDRAAAGHVRADHHYILAASVPGSRIGVLLRKLPR
jgi:3-oxoacyl-[acyl-carrier-protein] synthase-3